MLVTEAAVKMEDSVKILLETPFGERIISEEVIIHFSQGILGFEGLNYFAFLDVPNHDDTSDYRLLQSLENPSFCLVLSALGDLVNPQDLVPYLEERTLKMDNVSFWSILAFDRGKKVSITANLKAPLLIDWQNREGWQVILYQADYPIDFTLPEKEKS